MEKRLHLRHTHVIPNGVAIDLFKPSDRKESMEKSGFADGINIIFVADPARPEKNYALAKDAVERMGDPRIHLHTIFGKSQQELVWYYNAADMLLLTSLWEGSPNVVKEAMSCNLPIVATDVGDVKEIIGQTEGCFVCSYNENDIIDGVQKIMNSGKRTNGRGKIIQMELDSIAIAKKVINAYEAILKLSN
ncbi:MAG TPA: glycosyltransferase family 4 protein [Bacteroidales bacterium]